ncbi:hypothetical protein ACLB2K_027169 [Fragaria x ananassa]
MKLESGSEADVRKGVKVRTLSSSRDQALMVALLLLAPNQSSMWSISLLLDLWLKSLKLTLMVLEVSGELAMETYNSDHLSYSP